MEGMGTQGTIQNTKEASDEPRGYPLHVHLSSSGLSPRAVQTAHARSAGHATRPQFFVRFGPGFITASVPL